MRGGIAAGGAILDVSRNIFLGQPIVEAARLEKGQRFIGSSFGVSLLGQTIPNRFTLQFDQHIKENFSAQWSGMALDWPRHWRDTRSDDIREVIQWLDQDPQFSEFYKNTLDFISYSNLYESQWVTRENNAIRANYEQFSYNNQELAVKARAVRRVPI